MCEFSCDEPPSLHEERLDRVVQLLIEIGAESVLDLGCGTGRLLTRLVAEKQFKRIVGVDISISELTLAKTHLESEVNRAPSRLSLYHCSFTDEEAHLVGFDAAVMVETIEHVDPQHLWKVERSVFSFYRPKTLLITTPNREYNPLFNLPEGNFRHPDHRFEWTRSKFQLWARRLAERHQYRISFSGIGAPHSAFGHPSQMAHFTQL